MKKDKNVETEVTNANYYGVDVDLDEFYDALAVIKKACVEHRKAIFDGCADCPCYVGKICQITVGIPKDWRHFNRRKKEVFF